MPFNTLATPSQHQYPILTWPYQYSFKPPHRPPNIASLHIASLPPFQRAAAAGNVAAEEQLERAGVGAGNGKPKAVVTPPEAQPLAWQKISAFFLLLVRGFREVWNWILVALCWPTVLGEPKEEASTCQILRKASLRSKKKTFPNWNTEN